jgi:hypothetical protein
MNNAQFKEISIDIKSDPDQYTRMPRELLLAQKVKRAINTHQALGWQPIYINFDPKGVVLKFRRMLN